MILNARRFALGYCCGYLRQFLLNLVVDPQFGKFRSHSNGILDSVGVRRTVSNETYAFNSQQRRAAIFGMVESLLEISESAARQQISHLPRNRRLQTLLQSSAHQIRDPLRSLQRHVTYKAVGDDYINFPVV